MVQINFEKGKSYIVPLQQSQYKLIQTLFERKISFSDSLFYDISAWTLPLTFNLQYAFSTEKTAAGKEITDMEKPRGQILGSRSNYAYLMEWNDYLAPAALNQLLNEGLIVKVATKTFTGTCNGNYHQFKYGTILIAVENQPVGTESVHQIVERIVLQTGIPFYPLETGLTTDGIDAGSSNFQTVRSPKVAVIIGKGTGMHEAGEAWHLLDQRYDLAVTCLESDDIARTDLNNYNFIFLSDGSYSGVSEKGRVRLKEWISEGNTLFASGADVLHWLKDNNMGNIKFKKKVENAADKSKITKLRRAYAQAENDKGAYNLNGAIFETDIDSTHPLCYGYNQQKLSVFVSDTSFLDIPTNAYAAPLQFSSNPLLSGYIHPTKLELMKNSAALCVYGVGSGRLIASSANMNFRGMWYGTNKIFANAVFFGNLINRGCVEK